MLLGRTKRPCVQPAQPRILVKHTAAIRLATALITLVVRVILIGNAQAHKQVDRKAHGTLDPDPEALFASAISWIEQQQAREAQAHFSSLRKSYV